jgi:hypothetical protein
LFAGLEGGLVRGGGQVRSPVARAELDLAEGLRLGPVHEALGHRAAGPVGAGPGAGHRVARAGLAVIWGGGSGRGSGVNQGAHPGMAPKEEVEFPIPPRADHEGPNSSPTFGHHTR